MVPVVGYHVLFLNNDQVINAINPISDVDTSIVRDINYKLSKANYNPDFMLLATKRPESNIEITISGFKENEIFKQINTPQDFKDSPSYSGSLILPIPKPPVPYTIYTVRFTVLK